jgi:hypothetical protein
MTEAAIAVSSRPRAEGLTSFDPNRIDSAKFELSPGKIVGLEGPAGWGLTRLGLSLLAAPSQIGTVVVIDVRGWFSPLAAWQVGVNRHRLVVVRCGERRLWARVTAAVLEGVAAVYAEIPPGVGESDLRRLAALTRARKAGLALRPLRGSLPPGITHMRVRGSGVDWMGPDRGHGRLLQRQLSMEISGKSIPLREVHLEDPPTGSSSLPGANYLENWRQLPGKLAPNIRKIGV